MNRIKYLVGLLLFSYSSIAQLPNSWNKVANFSSTAREAGVSFSIDSFGYVGLGTYQNDTTFATIFPTDLWQYNPYTNTWVQKANFPIAGRVVGMCFVIGSKAYIGLGYNFANYYDDIWEYDPSLDTWTQKANFPGGGREGSACFSIGNYGYVGLGQSDTAYAMNDFWKYDPALDSWSRLGDFPKSGIFEIPLFTIGNYGYTGFGFTYQTQTQTNDIWQYNSTSDTWTQLADFPGDTISGWDFSFSVGDKGYTEIYYDSIPNDYSSASHSMYFWQYNPSSDTWSMKDSFTGGMRQGVASFTIGNHGYAGIGSPYYPGNCVTDFWMYTPDSIATGIEQLSSISRVNIYPNPTQGSFTMDISAPNIGAKGATITVTDVVGQTILNLPISLKSGYNKELISLGQSAVSGVYIVQLTVDGESLYYKVVLDR